MQTYLVKWSNIFEHGRKVGITCIAKLSKKLPKLK